MYIPNISLSEKTDMSQLEDLEESKEHAELSRRLHKTLYYGRPPGSDRPSLPLTELAVEYFRETAPKELGRVDMYFASSTGRKAYASPCSLMVGMMYLRRLRTRNPDYLQQISSSDLFLISMLVASKYMYDEGTDEEVYNDEWADAADMETADVNELERDFLQAIDWNLFVGEEEFAQMLASVEAVIARDKGGERGFYTYTDLRALGAQLSLAQALLRLLNELMSVLLVCSLAYAAGAATLAASPHALHMARSTVAPVTAPLPATTLPSPNDSASSEQEPARPSSLAGLLGLMTLWLKNAFDKASPSLTENRLSSTVSPDTGASSPLPGSPMELLCRCGACALQSSRRCHNVTAHDEALVSALGNALWVGPCRCDFSYGYESSGLTENLCENVEPTCCCCEAGALPPLGKGYTDIVLGFQTSPMLPVAV